MDNKGFTLLEIMIAMMVGSILIVAIFKTFIASNKAVALQMRKAEVMQNLRSSMFVIEAEIKRIGYNPACLQGIHAPGITRADVGSMSFQADLNENGRSFSVNAITFAPVKPAIGSFFLGKKVTRAPGGLYITKETDPHEVITLGLKKDSKGNGDTDNDGVANSFPCLLWRDTISERGNAYHLPVANNIEVVNFVYLNNVGDLVDGTVEEIEYPVSDIRIPLIKKIQITIIARSSTERHNYVNNHKYSNAQDQTILEPMNDGYERTMLTKTIDCRNLGLF